MNHLSQNNYRRPNLNFLQLRQSFTDLRQSVDSELLVRYDRALDGLDRDIWSRMSTDIDKRREGESPHSYNQILYALMDDMDNPYASEIRVILYDSGIAFPLWWGDWLVNRAENAQSEMLGIRPQHEVMDYIARTSETGVIQSQYIALNLGPGNGYMMHEIFRHQQSTTKKWNMVGLADNIYFPLSEMLENFWKGDDRVVGAEVARFLTTQIQYAVQDEKNRYPKQKHPLQNNLRDIREFLEHRTDIVSRKIQNNQYLADDEFDRDRSQKVTISKKAQRLIRAYVKDPEAFVARYFGEDFRGDAIIKKAPIYMRNIFRGDFSQIDEKFPGKDVFHFISSVRGSSHIDNEPYKDLIRASLKKLAPGGLMIDDGVRRSYTAEVRVEEIIEILRTKKLKDVRAYAIRSPGGNIISVLFEKAGTAFRSESDLLKHVVLPPNTLERIDTYASGEEFNETLPPNVRIRNQVMRSLDLPIDEIRYPTISQMNEVVEYINKNYENKSVDEMIEDAQNIVYTLTQKIRAEISLSLIGVSK